MILDKIVVIIPFIIPMLYIGIDISNILMLIISSLYIIMNRKYIRRYNKFYVLSVVLLLIPILISIVFIENSIYSISGATVYLNLLTYYMVFKIIREKNNLDTNEILKIIIYLTAFVNVMYLFLQLCIEQERLSGIFGYANTEGILLFSIFVLNDIYEFKFKNILSVLFGTLIFATGSRTTLLILLLYVLIRCFNDKNILKIVDVLVGMILYIIIAQIGIVGFLIAPILIMIYNSFSMKDINNRNVIIVLIILLGIMFSSSANTIERIKNISIDNGSFQERIITFEDCIESIKNNPLGKGINTYNFKSYEDSSAFYSQKYMHNSLLSIGYEVGILGIVGLIVFILQVNKILIKNEEKRYIILFNLIFIHSLLDFDFVFAPIMILISLIVVVADKQDHSIINKQFVSISILVISLMIYMYVGLYEVCVRINSIESLSIAQNMLYKDYRANFYLSAKYMENGDLKNTLDSLNLAKQLEPNHPFIKWNLAFTYKEMDMYDEAIKQADEVLVIERYNKDLYELYHKIILEKNKDNHKQYIIELSKIEEMFYKAMSEINPRARYIKNQLPSKLENIINDIK